MTIKKWQANNCWVHDIKLKDIHEELKEYHPKFPRSDRTTDSYRMDLISKDIEDEYYIQVTTDGSNGTGWKDETKKLLDSTVFRVDPDFPDRLVSDPKIDLLAVVGKRFGRWGYVSISVDFKKIKDYREYTTTMLWEKSKKTDEQDLLAPVTTYKWRD